MEELFSYRQDLLSALEADVTLLAKIEAVFSSHEWHRPSGDDQPTPHYVLVRLWADDAHRYAPHIRRILDEDMPQLPDFDVEIWLAEHYDPQEPAQVIIENFASLRTWQVGLLCGLAPASWSRLARHPRWGVRTLQWWVEQQRDSSNQHLSRLASLHHV